MVLSYTSIVSLFKGRYIIYHATPILGIISSLSFLLVSVYVSASRMMTMVQKFRYGGMMLYSMLSLSSYSFLDSRASSKICIGAFFVVKTSTPDDMVYLRQLPLVLSIQHMLTLSDLSGVTAECSLSYVFPLQCIHYYVLEILCVVIS